MLWFSFSNPCLSKLENTAMNLCTWFVIQWMYGVTLCVPWSDHQVLHRCWVCTVCTEGEVSLAPSVLLSHWGLQWMYGVTLSDWYTSTKFRPHCLALCLCSLTAAAGNSLAGFKKSVFSESSSDHRCCVRSHSAEFTDGSRLWILMFRKTFSFSGPAREQYSSSFEACAIALANFHLQGKY